MARAFAEIAFTPAVQATQERQGSAKAYGKFLDPEAERGDRLSPAEAAFVAERDGFHQARLCSPAATHFTRGVASQAISLRRAQ